jgi:tripartite-type tricarboxylate transporter receptor subunit TctC
MNLCRRKFLHLGAAVVASQAVPRMAQADTYPNRRVRVVVPAAPGGTIDILARLIAQNLSDTWGESFYVENRPTGSGTAATEFVAKAPADGYTILFVSTSFVIDPGLYAKLPYDAVRDFTPVTMAAASPQVLVVHPSVAANTVSELVALVKANPGKYSYASPGIGTSGAMASELFRLSSGLDLICVPFNSAPPAIISTIGGYTQISITSLGAAAASVKDGELRALAVTSAKRAPGFPDVSTLTEAGFPGQESLFIQGVVVPAGTPKEVIDKIYREIARIVFLPDVKEHLMTLDDEPIANTPEQFEDYIKAEIPRWEKVIRDANIAKVD